MWKVYTDHTRILLFPAAKCHEMMLKYLKEFPHVTTTAVVASGTFRDPRLNVWVSFKWKSRQQHSSKNTSSSTCVRVWLNCRVFPLKS